MTGYIISAILLWGGITFLLGMARSKNASNKNTYACPNCGHRFKVKWQDLLFSSNFVPMISGDTLAKTARLKCPKCNSKNLCVKPYDY
jgi:DNA-directed RNA polymerase subunit RPC12/RpoP